MVNRVHSSIFEGLCSLEGRLSQPQDKAQAATPFSSQLTEVAAQVADGDRISPQRQIVVPPYDPTTFACSVEEAVAPVGLTAYGGADYVPARWTRFGSLQEVLTFQEARNNAFHAWAQDIVKGLKDAGYDAEIRWDPPETPSFGGTPQMPYIKIPSLNQDSEFSPGPIQYDEWTWAGLNPVEKTLQLLNTRDGGVITES